MTPQNRVRKYFRSSARRRRRLRRHSPALVEFIEESERMMRRAFFVGVLIGAGAVALAWIESK